VWVQPEKYITFITVIFFRGQFEEISADGRIILRWIFRKLVVGEGHRLDRSGSGQVQVAGTCECGNEPSGSIKCGEFLD
jgi:hypothetical protein